MVELKYIGKDEKVINTYLVNYEDRRIGLVNNS